MTMELMIQEFTLPEAITFNYDQLKQEIATQLTKYEGLVYTEENLKEAVADRARLNALREAIEQRRISLKKECMKPYAAFEAQVKDIVALIDKPILAIDTQIKTYEDQQKAKKRDEIEAYYIEIASGLEQIVPFDKIMDHRWLNKTVTIKSIRKSISETVSKINEGLMTLETLKTPHLTVLKKFFIESGFDMTATLTQKARLEVFDSKMKEREAAVAPSLPAETSVERTPEDDLPGKAEQQPQWLTEEIAAAKDEPRYTVQFQVEVTKPQLIALRDYMIAHKIKFGKVE